MIKNIGVIVNHRKKQPVQVGKKLIKWLEKRGIAVYSTETEGNALEMDKSKIHSNLGEAVDCVITLGGDGTLLRAARMMYPYAIPILGINLGNLGFLTEIELNEIDEALERLIGGMYHLEDRMMLEARVKRNGRVIQSFVGLNDVVVTNGSFARLIVLDIYAEDEFITTYKADGVILSTPTGSTAYSLSAGGPIVYPEVDVTIVTPICPHTIQNRSLVLPPQKTVRVVMSSQHTDSMLTIDGQSGFKLNNGDEIVVSQAPNYTRLVRIKEYEFFSILQEKLRTEGRLAYE